MIGDPALMGGGSGAAQVQMRHEAIAVGIRIGQVVDKLNQPDR